MTEAYRVEITNAAEREAAEIHEYIRRDDPAAAIRWVLRVEDEIATLELQPRRCVVIPRSCES